MAVARGQLSGKMLRVPAAASGHACGSGAQLSVKRKAGLHPVQARLMFPVVAGAYLSSMAFCTATSFSARKRKR